MSDQDRQPSPDPGQAAPRPAPCGVERDAAGMILRGPCLPCGCPLDSGCGGWHPGRQS
jgi:hypothetical protein